MSEIRQAAKKKKGILKKLIIIGVISQKYILLRKEKT